MRERRSETFLRNPSTIHGVSYIADASNSKLSRIFWTIVFILSITGLIFCTARLCISYIDPDIALKVSYVPARNAPFPAITICPQTKVQVEFLDYSEAFKLGFKDNFTHLTSEQRKFFEMALQLCPGTADYLPIFTNVLNFTFTSTLSGDEFVKYMSKAQFQKKEFIEWGEFPQIQLVDEIHRVLTDEGLCFTFNLEDYSTIFRDGLLHEDFESFRYG
jgi:acid-sensing ion channel, other